MTLRSSFGIGVRLPVYAAETGAGSGSADPAAVAAPQSAAPVASPDVAGNAAAAGGPELSAAAAPIVDVAAAAPVVPDAAAAAAPAAAVEPAASEQKPTSLIGDAEGKKPADAAGEAAPAEPKKDEAKPADAKPEGDKKPDGEAPAADAKPAEGDAAPAQADAAAEVPPAVVFQEFKFPEGVKADEAIVGKFTEVLGGQLGPLEAAIKTGDREAINKAAQDLGQNLVDFYQADITKTISEQATKHQRDVWNGQVQKWITETKNDPELGGARINTSLSIAKAVVEEFGGTKEQVAEFINHMTNNGMGNFSGMVRLLNNIGQRVNIFEDSIVPATPPQKTGAKTRADKWYGDAPSSNTPA